MARARERREGILTLLRVGVPGEPVARWFHIPEGLMRSLVESVATEPPGAAPPGWLRPEYPEATTRLMAGQPIGQVSAEVRIQLDSARRWDLELRRLRGDPPRRGGRPPHPRRAEGIAWYRAGNTITEVAKGLGVNWSTAESWIPATRKARKATSRRRMTRRVAS